MSHEQFENMATAVGDALFPPAAGGMPIPHADKFTIIDASALKAASASTLRKASIVKGIGGSEKPHKYIPLVAQPPSVDISRRGEVASAAQQVVLYVTRDAPAGRNVECNEQ